MPKKFSLFFILLILTNPLFAQKNPKNTLQTITINANKTSLTAADYATSWQTIQNNSGTIALVKNQDLQQNYSINVKDMFDYVPGLIAQSKAGQESRLSIRGSGLSRTYHLRGINLYQDGIPINMADGSADFQDIDPLAFDYVEIYKGASANHLGTATLGGAINFISPTGYNSAKLKTRIEGGSFGSSRFHVAGGKIIDKFDFYNSLSSYNSTGYRQQNQQNDTKFYSNFGYRISNNVENRTYLTIVNSNLEMPGAISQSTMQANPKQANLANLKNRQERNFNQLRLANKTTWRFDKYTNTLGFYSNLKDLDHPIFQVIDQKLQNYGIFSNSQYQNKLFKLDNEINFGSNFSYGFTNSKRFINNSGSAGNPTQKGDEKAYNLNLFAENNLKINPKLQLTFGTQFILANRDFKDRFLSDGNQSGKRKYFGLSPKFQSLYKIDANTQIFSGFSASFEPPTFSELRQTTNAGLANIAAQKSYNLELGARKTNDIYNWDIAIYRSHLRDELMLYTISPNVTQAINANKTLHQGLELSFESEIFGKYLNYYSKPRQNSNKITLRTAYTLNDFRFVNDRLYGNNIIPGAPRHYIRSEIKFRSSYGFYLAPNLEFMPSGFFIDSANTVKSPSYHVVSINSGFDLHKNASFYIDIRNLSNKKYSPTADVLATSPNNPAVYYPANGRSVFAGLKHNW